MCKSNICSAAVEKHVPSKENYVIWFVDDLTKAFVKVDGDSMPIQLYGVSGHLLSKVRRNDLGSKACVCWKQGERIVFGGSAMSSWLLSVYMDGVIRVVNANVLGEGLEWLGEKGRSWQLSKLLFTDDTAPVADLEEKIIVCWTVCRVC